MPDGNAQPGWAGWANDHGVAHLLAKILETEQLQPVVAELQHLLEGWKDSKFIEFEMINNWTP